MDVELGDGELHRRSAGVGVDGVLHVGQLAAEGVAGLVVALVVVGLHQREARVDDAKLIRVERLQGRLAPGGFVSERVASGDGRLHFGDERLAKDAIDVGHGGLHGVGREPQPLEPFGGGDVVAVGLVVHLEAMHVVVLGQVEGLGVEVLPLFPAVGPAGRGAGGVPGEAAVCVVDLDDRVDVQTLQLAEGVVEIDDVAAGGRTVGVVVVEVGPVDVAGVQRIGAERGAAGDERILRADAVAPGGEVVMGFDNGGRRPDTSAVDVREPPPVGGVAAGHEVAAVVADDLGGFAGE